MRKQAAMGFLFVVGVLLVWSAFMGHTGLLLATILAPQQVHIEGGADQGDIQGPTDTSSGPTDSGPGNLAGPNDTSGPPPLVPLPYLPPYLPPTAGPPTHAGPTDTPRIRRPQPVVSPGPGPRPTRSGPTDTARIRRPAPAPRPAPARRPAPFSLSRLRLRGRF